MALFAIIAFLSAFLLFQAQPILGRYVLPWFGGGPAVWTSCLLFFQLALLLGYLYAFALSSWVSARRQWIVHALFLGASLLLLPIVPEAEVWKPQSADQPTLRILWLLLANIGLPYTALASTTPLIQHWFHQRFPDISPYRLYALSNVGSLLALVSYPALFEPVLGLNTQAWVWSWAYGSFAVVSGICAFRATNGSMAPAPPVEASGSMPARTPYLLWIGMPTCGSILLMAATSQMTFEVAVVPFLWVLPLTIYLLSFILVFESNRWYHRKLFSWLLAAAVPLTCLVFAVGSRIPFWASLVAYAGALGVGCMCCHGELAAARPEPRRLTLYYLSIAAGGALGGLFVALLAPAIFTGYWELHIGFSAACLLLAYVWWAREGWRPVWGDIRALRSAPVALTCAALLALASVEVGAPAGVVYAERNFYGVLRVSERGEGDERQRRLSHGTTLHGFQYLAPGRRRLPTAYYGAESALGLALRLHPRRQSGEPLRIAAIGLGAGTTAALAEKGDSIRFYEINPAVAQAAEEYFTFLSDSPAQVEVVLGDARVRLEQELRADQAPRFDVIAIDAFSSQSIPTHLLTIEAAQLYQQLLRPGGLLLFHISNHYLDLTPVMRGLSERMGWGALHLKQPGNEIKGVSAAYWTILTTDEGFLEFPALLKYVEPWSPRGPVLWTDDFAGLWRLLRW